MRSQSRAYVAGAVLGVVALAGCGVLALLRPQGAIGDNKILLGKDSGAVYAVIDGTVHPALNLASARLAVGDPAKPVSIKESELAKKPLGALIGIPGAPASLNFAIDGAGRQWTVCDEMRNDGTGKVTETVIAGSPTLDDKARVMDPNQALLVQGKDATYLIYNNHRAKIDMNDSNATAALHIRDQTPRPISEGLLNSIPEVLKITPPTITDPGATPGYPLSGNHHNGDVVHVDTLNKDYVVLSDGLQEISPFTVDLIRNANPDASANHTLSQPDQAHAPTSHALAVTDFPETAPQLLNSKDSPVSCLSWKPLTNAGTKADGSAHATLSLLAGHMLPIPTGSVPTRLAQADSPGSRADQFYKTPGDGVLVQSTGIEVDSQRKDSEFFLSDTGVRYGVPDADSAKALGMDSSKAAPELAPWPIVSLLASGPTLSRQGAMVAHDGVAPDPSPAKVLVTTSAAKPAG